MSTTRILLVEDDEDDYVLALDYLDDISFLNIEVIRAKNAEQTFEYMRNETFDLCLLDYQLGAINGLEVLDKSQELNFTAPVIMLTGHRDDVLDQKALDGGAVDYLVKSEIDSIRFARAIRYALARRDIEIERVERLKAEAENRSKNRFLAHLSHELRTPLTAILGYTELLINSERGQESLTELDVILRNSRHLLNLLNDILDLSKIAADKLELNSSYVSIENLIADVYSLLQVSALDKGISLELNTLTPIPTRVYTDPTRLRQILINLLNNAIKFTEEGGVQLNMRMATVEQKEMLFFDIKDTGVGIPEEQLEAIFMPFTQAADVITKSVGGTGLGLAICTELTKRLGGGIELTSALGEGSCFTAYIDPGELKSETRKDLTFSTSTIQQPKRQVKHLKGRVLVVDDLRDIRSLIGHIVKGFGLEVRYASNGRLALHEVELAKRKNQPFDLVLMDIHMPVMDGKATAKALRSNNFSQAIIALTAASMKGSFEKLSKCGFDNVLSKPVDTEKLYAILSQYLETSLVNDLGATNNMGLEKKVAPTNKLLKLLVVEDDIDTASALKSLLEAFDSEVHIATTVAAAKDKLNTGGWDVIMTDLNLPDGSGLDLIHYIQSTLTQGAYGPFISLVTGSTLDQDAKARLNINRVMLKPVQMSDIKDILIEARVFLDQ